MKKLCLLSSCSFLFLLSSCSAVNQIQSAVDQASTIANQVNSTASQVNSATSQGGAVMDKVKNELGLGSSENPGTPPSTMAQPAAEPDIDIMHMLSAENPNARVVVGINGLSGLIDDSSSSSVTSFNKLKIGMSGAHVNNLVGYPTDTSSHIVKPVVLNGKIYDHYIWVGSKTKHKIKVRIIYTQFYKNKGTLILVSNGFDTGTLVFIKPDPKCSGYNDKTN
jgi:hypothetical protein